MSTSQDRPLAGPPAYVRYQLALWAHEQASIVSRARQSDFKPYWVACPAARACARAGECMLVTAREWAITRARHELARAHAWRSYRAQNRV
jgi:hypothetical protein